MNHLQMGENLDSHYILDAYNTRIQQNHPPQYMYVEEIRDHLVNNHTVRHRDHLVMAFRPFHHVDDIVLMAEHHTDIRMNTEDMSYENLLALEERIGNAATSLSEEMIINQMKTKIYSPPTNPANLEEADSCVICQDEFKDKEEIGILECRHQYHSHCLKTWLLVKNVCPMCKSEAIHLK